MHPNASFQNKKSQLFIVLSSIVVANALLAELLGVKIFSLETLLGVAPAQIPLLNGMKLDFNLTAGVVLWPVVFITSDIINEYFGKAGVKRVSWLTVILILYAFLAITIITALPSAAFWLDLNNQDTAGRPFDMDFAFNGIFRQGLGIIIGSVSAFLLSQFLDASVFQYLRKFTGPKMIWLRATGSTLVSQILDSFVVLFIAFFVFGNWDLKMVLSVSIINYIYKFIMAIALTPLLYLAHSLIDRYLGKEEAQALEAEAVLET
ncbi:queuosine precursor transporter [Adhaeribacter soli]|uniref:Probable queuosine precursor transporter n=1 Tax=Adhaeribacter soli TaxID=2607655 RepID=A0A5N1IRV3_9BACT|nr:queuosine precursor transporter [Adhaeribacter soli]KAA9332740.1 queuosine precursor transporter [Adhaeribacter soli]